MDWESYRTDIEAIKLAVNECERLGVDKEELLIISIYRLYEFYKTWKAEQESHKLKDCFFQRDAEGNLQATLTTVGGEHYEKLDLRITEDGYLQTEQDVPSYIMKELVIALKAYAAQEAMISPTAAPRPRAGGFRKQEERSGRGRKTGVYGQMREFGKPGR